MTHKLTIFLLVIGVSCFFYQELAIFSLESVNKASVIGKKEKFVSTHTLPCLCDSITSKWSDINSSQRILVIADFAKFKENRGCADYSNITCGFNFFFQVYINDEALCDTISTLLFARYLNNSELHAVLKRELNDVNFQYYDRADSLRRINVIRYLSSPSYLRTRWID